MPAFTCFTQSLYMIRHSHPLNESPVSFLGPAHISVLNVIYVKLLIFHIYAFILEKMLKFYKYAVFIKILSFYHAAILMLHFAV